MFPDDRARHGRIWARLYVPFCGTEADSLLLREKYGREGRKSHIMEATAHQMHLLPPATDLFPHEAVRKGQGQFLENARSCMSNRVHLLAHAPTGLGKTAVSLSAALETTLENDGFIFFLTSRQSQHSVAIETLKRIWKKRQIACIDLIAREDMCLSRRSGHTPCVEGEDCYFLKGGGREAAERLLRSPLHVHESVRLCLKAGACPHMAAMAALKEAHVAVCDYNQVFGRPEFSLLDRTERSPEETVLIVDEGHNLPSRIMRNNTGVLSEWALDTALSSARLRHFAEELKVLKAALLDLASNRNDKVHLRARDLDGRLRSECGVDVSGLAEEMIETMDDRDLRQHKDLIDFLQCWNAFGEASIRLAGRNPRRLVSKLIEPAAISAPIMEGVRCALIMSATLHPPEMFADMLGLNARYVCYRYPSPFPESSRLLLAVRGVTSRYKARSSETYAAIANRIAEVCSATPGNAAVFFPSYEFMQKTIYHMADLVISKRMIVERREYGKNERNAILANMESSGNAVLMAAIGGSFSEGVDFRNGLLSAVVVVGLPMSPPSLEAEAMRQRMEARFGKKRGSMYAQLYPAVSKVLQAAGRAIRCERDRAVVVLMDDRYFARSILSALPNDFRPIQADDLPGMIGEFFGYLPHESDGRTANE